MRRPLPMRSWSLRSPVQQPSSPEPPAPRPRDLQAMARVHRIGQTKPVHIYRLVTQARARGARVFALLLLCCPQTPACGL
jgi:hypothetical protein